MCLDFLLIFLFLSLFFFFILARRNPRDKSTGIYTHPYINHRIEDVLWTVLPIDPWERGSIRNLTPTYDTISIQFPSLRIFIFTHAEPEKKREREREVRFYPESAYRDSRAPAAVFQVRRISNNRQPRNLPRAPLCVPFMLQLVKFELSPIANIILPPEKKMLVEDASLTEDRRNR